MSRIVTINQHTLTVSLELKRFHTVNVWFVERLILFDPIEREIPEPRRATSPATNPRSRSRGGPELRRVHSDGRRFLGCGSRAPGTHAPHSVQQCDPDGPISLPELDPHRAAGRGRPPTSDARRARRGASVPAFGTGSRGGRRKLNPGGAQADLGHRTTRPPALAAHPPVDASRRSEGQRQARSSNGRASGHCKPILKVRCSDFLTTRSASLESWPWRRPSAHESPRGQPARVDSSEHRASRCHQPIEATPRVCLETP